MSIILHLDELDRMLAREIQPDMGYFSQFLCRAYSQGHTAIRYENGALHPEVSTVFTVDGREYLSAFEVRQLDEQIRRELDDKRFSNCIQDEPFLSLPFAYAVEEGIAMEISRIRESKNIVPLDSFDYRLKTEQLQAIKGSLQTTISTITGGPGTGKTFTAGVLLSKLAQLSSKRLHVALLAPTGRAVKNLQASIMRFFTNYQNSVIEAQTIHRALSEKCAYLPYDVVVVDEASMIDADMMLRLLRRLYRGTRTVFLGDVDQLPSIGPGRPFADMITAKTALVPGFRLAECVRTDSFNLRSLAVEVISGTCEGVFEIFKRQTDEIKFIDLDSCPQENVLNILKEEIFDPWRSVQTLESAQNLVGKIALLCAVRKGRFGVETLNAMGGHGLSTRFCPVISTKNAYHLNVMNADLGTLDTASGLIYFKDATIPAVLCPGIESAYAMTVHKSQGSEFDTVIFVLAQGTVCDAKLLYTAITRAKRRVIVIAGEGDVRRVLQQHYDRESPLAHILRKIRL